MEVVGFVFGLMGFVVATSAMAKLRKIEAELREKGVLTDATSPPN